LWCHQSGVYEPFLIYNGWQNYCDGSIIAATSGACYSAGPTGVDGMACYCEPYEVTFDRRELAKNMSEWETIELYGSKYLDLAFVMQSGDTLYYEQTEWSGWNSFCHGHFLAVNQSTGNWKSFTGCAEISPFQTFVNGQEV
jgi:hypothetical protein